MSSDPMPAAKLASPIGRWIVRRDFGDFQCKPAAGLRLAPVSARSRPLDASESRNESPANQAALTFLSANTGNSGTARVEQSVPVSASDMNSQ
jgi:hypothetical protein